MLPHELDTWNPNGESTFWVRVPQMERGLVLKMYYGKAGQSESNPQAVWGGYVGVWHMNMEGGVVAESANGFHGVVSNPLQVVTASGRVGGAYMNPSQTSGVVPCISVGDTNGSFAAFNALSGNLSFSAWIKYTGSGTAGKYGRWWCTSGGEATAKGMQGLDYALEGNAQHLSISDKGDRASNKEIPSIADDWHNVVVQYEGGRRKVYVDGVEMSAFDNSDSAAYVPRANTRWVFGSRVDSGAGSYEQWVGGLDEFRVYPGVLEPRRIAAEFKMLASDASYIHFVDETHDGAFFKHVDVTVTGYAGNMALTNFPLCIRVSQSTISGFRYSDLRADGRDVCFSGVDGSPLDFEVDTWNPGGESVYWVRVPELANGTVVRMSYGRAAPYHNGSVMGAVWSGYAGVWHVGETADGAVAVADSAPNAIPTTGGVNSAATNGVFGLSRGSRMTGNNGPSAFSTAYAAKLDIGTTFTVSFYLRRGVINANWAYLVTRKTGLDQYAAWGVQSRSSQGLAPGFWSGNDSPAPSSAYAFGLMDVNHWRKVDIVYDGFDRILYVDGEKVAEETKSVTATPGAKGLSVGGAVDFHGTFPGDVDEIRFHAGRKSDAWIKAEYDMSGLSGGTPFLSYGRARRFIPIGLRIIVR